MTELDKFRCAERELEMRRRVYPRLVRQNKMTQSQANWEIECQEAIVDDYRKIVGGTRLI